MKDSQRQSIDLYTRASVANLASPSTVNTICGGGQDLSFCVGLKAPFTSKSKFEEEETFGKIP